MSANEDLLRQVECNRIEAYTSDELLVECLKRGAVPEEVAKADDDTRRLYLKSGIVVDEMAMPIVLLNNGLTVGNFSSAHPFVFDDGKILPGCSERRCKAGSLEVLEVLEVLHPWPDGRATDVELTWKLNYAVEVLLDACHVRSSSQAYITADVVLVPFPVLEAVKRQGFTKRWPRIRVIRKVDRTSNHISSSQFCI